MKNAATIPMAQTASGGGREPSEKNWSQGPIVRSPITFELVAISIITTTIGTATTPLITAHQYRASPSD